MTGWIGEEELLFAETLALLRTRPDANEIVVDRARFVPDAEASCAYGEVLALLSSR